MDRRIFGLETEFGVNATFRSSSRLSPEEVARYLFRKVVAWGRSSNVFLGNGSRLYLDVGSHPEYATAECADLFDLIAHDRAGELVVQDLAEDAERRLSELQDKRHVFEQALSEYRQTNISREWHQENEELLYHVVQRLRLLALEMFAEFFSRPLTVNKEYTAWFNIVNHLITFKNI